MSTRRLYDNCSPTNRRLAVKATTGKMLPAEISEIIYGMLFSNKAWISHRLGNNARGGYNDRFLNTTRRGKICPEDVVERQLRKNSWARKLEDPHAKYSKRSSSIEEPGYSLQGLLGAFGEVVTILTPPSLAPNILAPPPPKTQIIFHLS